jgi:conjugative transfer ATPase
MNMLNFLKSSLHLSETRRELAASYAQPPSISNKLPWMDYDPTTGCFHLDDGRSVAAVFELTDVATDTKSEDRLTQLESGLQSVLQDVFPLYFDEESPWIVQFYLQDELSLKSFYESCAQYVKPPAKETPLTSAYLKLLKAHTDRLTQPEGVFVDTKVSGSVFRGKVRKIRVVIYRRLSGFSKLKSGKNAAQDLNGVAQTLVSKLTALGISVQRYTGKEFYDWMVRWFNPAPKQGDGSVEALLTRCPYPGDAEMPWGYEFSEKLFFSVPHSDQAQGVWYFDDKPHQYLTILGLTALPQTGHLSHERNFGHYTTSLFDQFPEGSVFVLTLVMQSQEKVKNHLFRIENSARRSGSMEGEMAREDCALAKRAIESGNYFFPTVMGVYLRGDDLADLETKETAVETLLSSHGFHHLSGDHVLTPIDSYLRYLPMAYSYTFDQARLRRSRYCSSQQIARLIPLYGRERGTRHPAITLFNRGGEPFTFDPFHTSDKDFNSHLLLLGTTGAGKSALCVYFMMQLMAVYKPRLVLVDAGNSFGLLCDYFKQQGLTVHRVEIAFNTQTVHSLNPFADSFKMLEQLAAKETLFTNPQALLNEVEETLEIELEMLNQEASTQEQRSEENRDYLGEMVLAAQLMITGGEEKEAHALTRQDRYWILTAVVQAAKAAQCLQRQMLASDLIDTFHELAVELEKKDKKSDADVIQRLKKMAANLALFCQDTLSAQYFNTPGEPWPEADVTLLEMGLFKYEGYEAQRALAFMGAMNKTLSQAEQHQYGERFTVLFVDECHGVTSNPLTALSVTKCAKMSRKVGLWLWFATQNVKDFPDESRKMLSMMEFWICLGMSESEICEIERFKFLSEDERRLFRSVRKEAKKYVEGVILCSRFKGLFRNIPPRLSLALAMTETHEKTARRKIMQAKGCSEIEAAIYMAEEMLKD